MVHLHKKNLETLMKSRNEFTTNEEYNEYLRIYFTGLALQGLISSFTEKVSYSGWVTEIEETIKCAIYYADELLKQLENK